MPVCLKFAKLLIIGILIAFVALISTSNAADSKSQWPTTFDSGPEQCKFVALTFDDAPSPDVGDLLSILDDLNVEATFFILGEFAEMRPLLFCSIVDAGHEIGNHSFSHPDMTLIDDDAVANELESTNEFITRKTGIIPHLFRPPGGNYDSRLIDWAYSHQMTTVLWTVNTYDYQDPSPDEIVRQVVNNIHSGAVILMHDGVDNTRQALPIIVEELRQDGYSFVTVGDLIDMTYGECPWPAADKQWCEEPDIVDFL